MSRLLRVPWVVALVAAALSVVAPAAARPSADISPLPPANRPVRYAAQATSPLYPYANTFKLHSLPGATRVIYLDFLGETIANTAWNDSFTNGASFYASPFDLDGVPSSFSNAEMDVIQSVWTRVAEKYAPFAVDVTTEDPTVAGIDRTGLSDLSFGTRALITNTTTIYNGCSCAGIAYVGTYGITAPDHEYYQPAIVFNQALGGYDKDIADDVAHEVGHNLGLSHDGTTTSDYSLGQGDWAPIMGAGYYHPLVQFSKGEYANANNSEDDFAVMQQNGLPLRADDYGNTIATASPFPSTGTAHGVISTDADVDVFAVNENAGPVTFNATPAAKGASLDIKLELLDASGNVLASDDPPSSQPDPNDPDTVTGLAASVSTSVAAGTYYVRVQGVGSGNPLTTGYTGYGSVGQYTLTGTVPTSVSIGNGWAYEGNSATTPVNFTVLLSAPSSSDVTVNYATADATALAGSDYVATSGVLTIPAGQTSGTISVLANGDTVPEPHEVFAVTLSNPVGASIARPTAMGWIVNDDGIGVSINDVSKYEGTGANTLFSFTVSLSNAPQTPITVTATTANGSAIAGGNDYWYRTQLLTFAAGQRTATFTVAVRGDSVSEADEHFFVNLTNPVGTNVKLTKAQGTGTILNDDS